MKIIACHLNADFDCLGSLVGAKKLYPDAVAVMPGSAEKPVRQFIERFHPVDILSPSDINLEDVTHMVVVDTSTPERLGPLKSLLENQNVKVHLYDHHSPE
ncbi:MAG: hypothetical protein D6778_01785, partial [Nitrospirae bacterium]